MAMFKKAKAARQELFSNAKPHEVMSYLIVTSNAFRSFFNSEIDSVSTVGSLDLERIGRMIIGKMAEPELDGYLGDIINGVFDADKLDYIQRDAYFSGLKMAVDLDRLLHSVWVPQKHGPFTRRLTVRTSAVAALRASWRISSTPRTGSQPIVRTRPAPTSFAHPRTRYGGLWPSARRRFLRLSSM